MATLVGRITQASRSVAAFIAFSGQVGLDEILKTCSWKNHTGFFEFFPKDMTQICNNIMSVGPVIAARRVVVH